MRTNRAYSDEPDAVRWSNATCHRLYESCVTCARQISRCWVFENVSRRRAWDVSGETATRD